MLINNLLEKTARTLVGVSSFNLFIIFHSINKPDIEHWHKKILKELESQFQFRKIMCEYICTALDRINEFAFLYHSYQEAIDVMEESFGYATNETLEKIIRSDYSATAKIYI